MHLYTSIYIYTYIYTSIYIYIHLYASIYIYMHLYTSIYIYIHIGSPPFSLMIVPLQSHRRTFLLATSQRQPDLLLSCQIPISWHKNMVTFHGWATKVRKIDVQKHGNHTEIIRKSYGNRMEIIWKPYGNHHSESLTEHASRFCLFSSNSFGETVNVIWP